MIAEIENLPDISFIDNITLDDVQTQMLSDYEERYQQLTGTAISLNRADPMCLVLYACSVQIFQALLFVDRTGKQDLLKYSYGEYLDNLAALKGVARTDAIASVVTVRFTLSGIRPSAVSIPSGTRVTNGELYWETSVYTEIAAGDEYADIICACQTAGETGNGILAGEIDTLVDPIAYVASVSNPEETQGGSDTEDDESLAERIYMAPSSYSVAGPEDAYVYWCKTFNSAISDVYVSSPEPGEVLIEFVLDDGVLPTDALCASLEDYLMDENIRPLTDNVTVQAPSTADYELDVEYYINKSDSAQAETIQAQVEAAIEEYVVWQRSSIGRDINPSVLIQKICDAGAKRAVVNSPEYTVIEGIAVANCTSQTVTYGGIEDD